jgi:hypothetical protein
MSIAAAMILAASTAPAPALAGPGEALGAQVASVQATATIVGAVVVRQASGLRQDRDRPKPQVSRHGRRVLFEFE